MGAMRKQCAAVRKQYGAARKQYAAMRKQYTAVPAVSGRGSDPVRQRHKGGLCYVRLEYKVSRNRNRL